MGGEIGGVAWHLIFKLALSEKHLEKVKAFLSQEIVEWDKLFTFAEPYESMYCLFLVQALIGDSSEKELAELRKEVPAEQRAEFRNAVLKHKGVQWAIEHLRKVKPMLGKIEIASYTKMVMNLITAYLIGAMKANEKLGKDLRHYTYQMLPKEELKGDNAAANTNKGPKMSTISMTFFIAKRQQKK